MTAATTRQRASAWPAAVPVGYALLVTVYIQFRYAGQWSEQDTGQIVQSIRATLAQQTISPTGAYPHGYAYQVISAALGLVTGLGVADIQMAVLPFLSLVVALAAFIAFRALTGSTRLGGIAAILLMIQPEFQFVIQRGSHEKVTHTLVLLLIFLLAISIERRPNLLSTISITAAFYLAGWALISTNSFFASSYIACLVLSLVGGLIILTRAQVTTELTAITRRLVYVVTSSFALLFVFLIYVYHPAGYTLSILRNVLDKVAALLLSFDPKSNPYSTLGSGPGAAWAAPWVYPVLTAFDWIIVTAAAVTWIWLVHRLWSSRGRDLTDVPILLMLLAPSFAFEVMGSVVTDLSGDLAGSNLELRLFPLFMLAGIPLAVIGLDHVLKQMRLYRGAAFPPISALVLLIIAATGILKATDDPLVSNKWLFYTTSEQRCVVWTDANLVKQGIWIGFDERLLEMAILRDPLNPIHANTYVAWSDPGARYVVWSTTIQQLAVRLDFPVPPTLTDDVVFDDGAARLYHEVPLTPYQARISVYMTGNSNRIRFLPMDAISNANDLH